MTQHLTHGGQDLPACVKRYISVAQYLDGSQGALKQLQLSLEERASALLDCNGELKDLSNKLEEYLQDWYPSAYPVGYEGKGISTKDDFYVIGCPELHPLPAKEILDGLREECFDMEGQKKVCPSRILIPARSALSSTHSQFNANASRERIQGEIPHFIGANFRCSKCIGDFPVLSKRKIEPLSRIASQIEQRLQSWQQIMQKRIDAQKVTPNRATLGLAPKQWAVANSPYSSPSLSPAEKIPPQPRKIPENFPEVANEHASPTSPQSFSNISIHSGLDSSKIDAPQKNTWQSFFKSNRSLSTLVSNPSYTFFACGQSLILWNERGSGFYDLRDADSISFRKINSYNVHLAAGGTNTCAVVAKTETVRCLAL